MFERFTDRARRVVVLAQEEARMMNHNFIGTEHILLGLVHEGEGVAAKALTNLGISLEQVRREIEQVVPQGRAAPENHIPFTPRAKKVLELALREALQLTHNYIGTEHLLLGLVREAEGVAAQVLTRAGADLERVRGEVMQLLGGIAPSRLDVVSLEAAVQGLVAELGPELRGLLPDNDQLGRALELAVEAVLRRPGGTLARLVADRTVQDAISVRVVPEPDEDPPSSA